MISTDDERSPSSPTLPLGVPTGAGAEWPPGRRFTEVKERFGGYRTSNDRDHSVARPVDEASPEQCASTAARLTPPRATSDLRWRRPLRVTEVNLARRVPTERTGVRLAGGQFRSGPKGLM